MVQFETFATTQEENSLRTKEKSMFLVSSLELQTYWKELLELLPQNAEIPELNGIRDLLDKNPLVDGDVLFRMFRLIEGIKLWHLHQGQKSTWNYIRKHQKYSAENVGLLLEKLTTALNSWNDDVFSGSRYVAAPEVSRSHYEPAARFVVSTAATLFATITSLSSEDVKAQTTRMALSLLDKEAPKAGYLRTLLTDRAANSGAKEDVGEDAFYETLTQLIASWNPAQRKAITKQLGDLLSISISSERNQQLIVPVTPEMAKMAVLLLTGIRQHNQNDADFADPTKEGFNKTQTTAARGAELGTEPLLAMTQHLEKTAKNGSFDLEVARQLFEAMVSDAHLANPAILIRLIDTFAHPKLREALQKAYSRRDQNIDISQVDDVIMYLLTGTLKNQLSNASYSLSDQQLQWASDNLNSTGYAGLLADMIRATAKFGLHTLNGLNPLPQMYIYQAPEVAGENVQQLNVHLLKAHIKASGASVQQARKISRANHDFVGTSKDNISIVGPLVANRKELSGPAKESLKIRMRRWLEVEQQFWKMAETAINTSRYDEVDYKSAPTASWSVYFTTGINLLSEPESNLFKIDPELVNEFAPILAERIVSRYLAIKKCYDQNGREGFKNLKNFATWALNQAAGHWDKTMITAVLDQVKEQVAKNDQHYAGEFISDFVNNIGLERVARSESEKLPSRAESNGPIIATLTDLLISFPNNTAFVGADGRANLMKLLQYVSVEKRSNEIQYITHHNITPPQKEDIAVVENLLNLLAGHAGKSKVNQGSEGQVAIATAINTAIGIEIGVELQTSMPSPVLMQNLLSSREKLEKQRAFADEKKKELSSAAAAELGKVKSALKKGNKLSLAKIKDLIGMSLGELGEGISAANQLKLNFELNPSGKTDEAKTEVDVYTFLANLAQQYLNHSPAAEIAPLGYELAAILRTKYHNEDLTAQPIEKLRQKLAAILSEALGAPLEEAVAQEAELEGQFVLAKSMRKYFETTDLLVALETARLTQEDLALVEKFFNQIKVARNQVADPQGRLEVSLQKIRKNLAPILGQATHLISMPRWEDIAWFIPDDVFAAAIASARTQV